MTEAEKAKNLEPVEASSSDAGSADNGVPETPMLAVWLSLAAIVVAGLYGIYLGTANKPKSNAQDKATSSLVAPCQVSRLGECGRPS